MRKAIIIILLGPGKTELNRFFCLLHSLCYFEGDLVRNSTLLIVNDGNSEPECNSFVQRCEFKKVVTIPNPFLGLYKTPLIYDRLMAGMLAALCEVTAIDSYDFILKIDTDALVCGTFSDRIKHVFETNHSVGMIGSLHHNPDGTLRDVEEWWAKAIRGTCSLIPLKSLHFHVKGKIPFRGKATFLRSFRRYRIMKAALRNGWKCGENILGGAYAISPLVALALKEKQLCVDSLLFEGTRISEDVGISMLVCAAGFTLREFNNSGQVFGIWYQQPTLSISNLVKRGYGIVHSVKFTDPTEEKELRAEYMRVTGVPPLE